MKLLQINPVLRASTSTGRIVQEIGETAMHHGWESHFAYSRGRDGLMACPSRTIPVGGAGSVAWHGLMTRLLDRHGLASRRATVRLIRRMAELRPDIVHLHNLHGYFLHYPLLFRYLSHSGIPVVWTVHDCWPFTGHCYYYSAACCDRWQAGCHHCPQRGAFPASLLRDRSAQNFADKQAAFTSMPPRLLTLVPVSQWLRTEIGRSFLAGYPCRVIRNGIDTATFRPQGNAEAVKSRYGLQGKRILLGAASIWSREKGLHDFLGLAPMLREDERIVLVGLSAKQQKHLPQGITGIARTANAGQLAELYAAATAFVNPTWQDNYPTVNLEAIACGTPVVTYRTGGSVESVTAGTGFIVEQGDLRGILAATRSVRPQERTAWRERCRAYALTHFRKEDRYADYLTLYAELAERTPHPR